MIDSRDTDWMAHADCATVDTDLFFPEKGSNTSRYAKSICNGCPVLIECREWALAQEELQGIWGGLTFRERQRERVQRGQLLRQVQHGTRQCYVKGCRRPQCVQADRDYKNAWAARRRAS